MSRRGLTGIHGQHCHGAFLTLASFAGDALRRWLDRLGYHTSRICHFLGSEDSSKLPLTDASNHPDE